VLKLGIPVLAHTVLLRGVNDDTSVLGELFNTLVDHGIQPYYINQLDKVQGAAHFEVPEEKGLKLLESLQETLSGYALPKYAKEVPGAKSKTLITNR
jgi:L-lysine 2,3-aminomutase